MVSKAELARRRKTLEAEIKRLENAIRIDQGDVVVDTRMLTSGRTPHGPITDSYRNELTSRRAVRLKRLKDNEPALARARTKLASVKRQLEAL